MAGPVGMAQHREQQELEPSSTPFLQKTAYSNATEIQLTQTRDSRKRPKKIVECRRKAKYHHDKSARRLPDIEVGADVYVHVRPDKKGEEATKAKVTRRLSDRKYVVIEESGRELTRNRQHIRGAGIGGADTNTEAGSSNAVPKAATGVTLTPFTLSPLDIPSGSSNPIVVESNSKDSASSPQEVPSITAPSRVNTRRSSEVTSSAVPKRVSTRRSTQVNQPR